MGWEAWFTVGVVTTILAAMTFTRIGADVLMVGGVSLLLLFGVVTAKEALAGLGNEGMVTVGVLYVVVAGIENTGGTAWIVQRLLGRPQSLREAMVRMMAPVTFTSAFLNNTPVVAMFLPAINDWAKQYRYSVSKLLVPLSYAAILGGVCTLIGTSTNLVVSGLVADLSQQPGYTHLPQLRMFDIAWVGIPVALVGSAFMLVFGNRLLPERKPAISEKDDPRSYTVEMLVEPASPLVGKTIEQAGLRQLPSMYLAEIDREGITIPAVSPQERLRADDRLVFVGIVESIVDLQKIRGLKPATDQVFKLDAPRSKRCLIEAVVSNTCPVVGQTIRDGRFRSRYNAVVIAVARAGERINKKIGDIVLRTGDTLLVEAHPSFADEQHNSKDFYLVSQVENSNPPLHEKAIIALVILFGMIFIASFAWLSMLQAGMLAAGLMIMTRCCTSNQARRSVDWQVLLSIAASFGIGRALETTGVAKACAEGMVGLAGGDAWMTLAVVYLTTLVLTELITNNAAAVLVFPVVMAAVQSLGVNPMPFIVAIMVAASCGFATPMGYQTHMMVWGPGGYRFSDFLRIGVPMDILVGLVCVLLSPFIWPFIATP